MVLYLSVLVLIPLAAVVLRSTEDGLSGFWHAITRPEASSSLKLTIGASLLVAFINLIFGTATAWLLVRDKLPGRAVLDTLIDLPFALPTIVAGLALLSIYGTNSPVGLNLAYARAGVVVALLFVTLPFVVRTVQPVLLELDRIVRATSRPTSDRDRDECDGRQDGRGDAFPGCFRRGGASSRAGRRRP